MAYKLLCDLAGVSVLWWMDAGRVPRFWTIVTVEQNVHRHVDPPRAEGLPPHRYPDVESGFVGTPRKDTSCGESLCETSTT